MNIIGIIPAAGVGSRMNQTLPKQYSLLLGKTVLEHSALSLLQDERVAHVYIPLHGNDPYFHTLPLAKNKKITSLTGGVERFDSVWLALNQAKTQHTGSTLVLVHDAARPGLSKAFLKKLIDKAMEHSERGAIAAVPAWDTMKQQQNNKIVTMPREFLWHAFTPQIFRLDYLIKAFEHARIKQLTITDESSAMEALYPSPILVEATQQLRKITCQDDLIMVEALMRSHEMN